MENDLLEDLKTIFSVKKATYDTPGESAEQMCLFVEIEQPRVNFREKRMVGRVTGSGKMYGRNDAMPVGYFEKAIRRAPKELTKRFHFSDMSATTPRSVNIVERSFQFAYFFDSQFDPDTGTMNEDVIITVEET